MEVDFYLAGTVYVRAVIVLAAQRQIHSRRSKIGERLGNSNVEMPGIHKDRRLKRRFPFPLNLNVTVMVGVDLDVCVLVISSWLRAHAIPYQRDE